MCLLGINLHMNGCVNISSANLNFKLRICFKMFFMSDTSESSSDEDSLARIRLQRKFIRQKSEIFSWPDDKFIEYFRLNKTAFRYVLETVEPFMRNGVRSTVITNTLKLASTLLFLAQGSYQFSVGNDFNLGLSQSAVSVSLEESLDALDKALCPLLIKLQTNDDEENETKTEFLNKTGFPRIIGCIGSTHIKIVAPCKEEQSLYKNAEGCFSLNALFICDHQLRIKYIDARNAGSYSTANIWNMSIAKHYLSHRYETGERNFCILGDQNFPLEPYLMTPFRSPKEGSLEDVFSKKHASALSSIDRTIDMLRNRFRCLLGVKPLHYKPAKAAKIAKVCAALHNVCIEYNTDSFNDKVLEENNEYSQNFYEIDDLVNKPNVEASKIRDEIKLSFLQ